MRGSWPRSGRLLARLLEALLPGRVAAALLRDLDEGHRRRRRGHTHGSPDRWLVRQLLLALRPGSVRDLRRMGRGGTKGPGPLRGLLAGAGTDLRQAVRLLASSPGFTVLTVVVLAGGMAVSIFTFSLLNTAMHAPLPLPAGDAVVRVLGVEDGRTTLLDAVDVAALRDNSDAFEVMGAWQTRHVMVRGGLRPRAIQGTFIEPGMFDVAGVRPLLGRRLLPSDAAPGAEPVVVLSHSVWQATFGGDAGVVGRRVELNGVPTRIVGVMPRGFGFPVFGQIWLPLEPAVLRVTERGREHLNVYGKLRPGISRERATAELHAGIQRIRADADDPELASEVPDTAVARTFQKAQFGDEADLMFATLHLAAGFILLLACVNAGNMLLARGLERGREIDVRLALGAPRLRLLVQMMSEGALITLLAGGLAVAVAGKALDLFDAAARAALPEGLAYWWRWGLDMPTLTAAAVLVAGTMLLVGGTPAWRVLRADTDGPLREEGPGGRTVGRDRVSRGLVVLQVTLISVLLFLGGATSLVARRAGDIDLGLDTDHVLVGILEIPADEYPDPGDRVELVRRLRARLEASAAVQGAVARTRIGSGPRPFRVEGRDYESEEQQPRAQFRASLGDPALIGIGLRAGRWLDAGDGTGAEPAALVSESLARELWGTSSPLGKRIRIGSVEEPGEEPWRVVVGVVSDILEGNPVGRDRNHRTVHVPLAQVAPTSVAMTFRHRDDTRAAVTAFHDALAGIDPRIVPERVVDLDDMLGTIQAMMRTLTAALAGCFGFALLLALGGIYGLASRGVTQRIHEIGIRRALGATAGRVVRLFLGIGGRQLAVGLAIAAAIAAPLSFAVTRYFAVDPLLFVGTGVAVAAVISSLVMVAVYAPTRRAVRLEPRQAIWRR